MKNNRSFTSMLTALMAYLTSGLRSKALRRAVGLLLTFSILMTSTGLVLAKEMEDETSDPTTGFTTELSEETSSETSEDETSEETSSDTEKPSDVSDTDGSVSEDPSDTEDTEMPSDTESSEDPENTDDSSESTNDIQDSMMFGFSEPSTDPSEQTTEPDTEKTVKVFLSETYSVIATYGPETGIPADAQLTVHEITDDTARGEYFEKLNEVMDNRNVDTARFFDISLVSNGVECEPADGTTVSVKIMLEEQLDGYISVVHLPDDQQAGMVDTVASNTDDGMEITFEAEGFSAYAIVTEEGIAEENGKGWVNLSSMAMLEENASRGIYIRSAVLDNNNGYHYMSSNVSTIKDSRTGITKTRYPYMETADAVNDPLYPAVPFYFENFQRNGNTATCQIYCVDGGTRKYLVDERIDIDKGSLFFGTKDDAQTFTITYNSNGTVTIRSANGHYFNEQGGANWNGNDTPNGERKAISEWKTSTNLVFSTYISYGEDPYKLNGKTYGLLNTKGGNEGRALQSTTDRVGADSGHLDSLQVTVVAKEGTNHQDRLYVSAEDGATMWTFTWVNEDTYYVQDESGKYLTISDAGLSVSTEPCALRVVPGTGTAANQITLSNGNNRLTFSGSASTGFNTNNGNDSWLYPVEERDLTADYKKTYSARKISVSDPDLASGSQVIVYTRRWETDPATGKSGYNYYAIDHDGSLHRCYESGDYLLWTENMINSFLWDFTIYYWEDKEPGLKESENNYYELYNEYSQKYIAPQVADGQILSDSKIGIQLAGRKNDRYYSTIVAWDDANYAYSGVITTDEGKIASGAFVDAEDFYFAILEESTTSDNDLVEIETIDNNLYGIEMKMQDFNFGNSDQTKNEMFRILENTGSHSDLQIKGLLSNQLDENGYPTITRTGAKLNSTLFNNTTPVNHLFIESTHEATGYFEYDSTQNFASLKGENEFTVYQQLGTNDKKSTTTMKHGQFLPYNTISDNRYAVSNPQNLYSMHARLDNNSAGLLSDSDPRKYERLYLVNGETNYQFGMEMSASFIQTPSGLDDWGHDIIYEFTGDDDFWFYVDGELVIDLGGCHSAMAGSINFATGEVFIDEEEPTTLKKIFYKNAKARAIADGKSEDAAEAEAQTYVDGLFMPNGKGGYVFKDYTTHTMKMFYLERGGGASNLHMKFNQSSVTPGKVVLDKKVTGIDDTDSVIAEFPYQIFYEKKNDQGIVEEYPLTNVTGSINVVYRGTNDEVRFVPDAVIENVHYSNVFFLKPGEECEITFPDKTINYRVVECAVNPHVYSKVYVNGEPISPTVENTVNGRRDYGIDRMAAEDRTNVQYVNEIDPDALRVLNIQKKLYKEDGTTEITAEDCRDRFTFRLYLSGEYEGAIPIADKSKYAAYMYNYHVKNAQGQYCFWSSSEKDFVSLGTTNFSSLTHEQKQSATFQTSMNGSISKIPAGYTVEVKGLMVGSHYMVEERDDEVPDGYSRRDYLFYPEQSVDTYTVSDDPVNETMGDNRDPKVIVNNLKGYGLRVYKEWTDKDFMDSHGDVFFAVYKNIGTASAPDYVLADSDPNAVPAQHDAVHCITTKSNTSYWYYEHLDTGLDLDDYVIREVKLEGSYTVDAKGVVTTDYASVVPVSEGGEIRIRGKMTGATQDAEYKYTVSYEQGTLPDGSNVRVDNVTNDRPGLGLTKTAWDGTTLLANAEFTVVSEDGTFRKKFVSDENGKITKAFFVKDMTYHLTEIKTPTGYYCPTEDITVIFRQDDTHGWFEVSDNSNGGFGTTTVQSGEDTLLGIKNMTYTLRVMKVDMADGRPLPGAHFALHKQIKVGGVTMFDYDPVTGYENIVTNEYGILEELDNTLPAGTYELRELSAPLGYLPLTHNIRFIVGDTGGITLLNNYSDVTVTADDSVEGTMAFEMKIKETCDSRYLTVTKEVTGNMASRDQKFDFKATFSDSYGNVFYGGVVNVLLSDGTVSSMTLDDTGSGTFQLAHGETIRFELPSDTVYSIEETTTGYKVTWTLDGGAVQTGSTASGTLTDDSTIAFTNTKQGVIPTGLDFTVKALLGAGLLLIIGGSAFAVVKKKRRDEEPDDEDLLSY